jgi:hypothetical protein
MTEQTLSMARDDLGAIGPAAILARLAQVERWLFASTIAIPAAFVVFFIVARWPEYWMWINFENTPMTSLEVGVMYTAALVAAACGTVYHVTDFDRFAARWWWALGAALFYLGLDDRFAIHERIRDQLLAPAGIRIPGLPIAPGDFILLAYALVGLVFTWKGRALWRARPAIERCFLAGVIVSAVAVLMDAYDIARFSIPAQRLEQTLEEICELIGQTCFLLAAWAALRHAVVQTLSRTGLVPAQRP